MTISIEETVVKEVAKKVIGKINTDALATKIAKEVEAKLPGLIQAHIIGKNSDLYDQLYDSDIIGIFIKKFEKDLKKNLDV
jgi:hypothetical protein